MDERLESVLRSLEEILHPVMDFKRPQTTSDLCERYPEYAEIVLDGIAQKLLKEEQLIRRGILQMTPEVRKKMDKERRQALLRNAKPGVLSKLYLLSGGAPVIKLEDSQSYLKQGDISLDIKADCELRQTKMSMFDIEGVLVGDRFSIEIDERGDYPNARFVVQLNGEKKSFKLCCVGSNDWMFDGALKKESVLSDYAHAECISIANVDSRPFAIFQVNYCAPLTVGTLLYALREMGAVTQEDLEGGDSWRKLLDK